MTQLQIKKMEPVFFDDVAAGSEIPPHTFAVNVVKMAMFASVSGDFFPSHLDNKWAIEKSGHPAAIAHGLHISCHLSQLVTNWIGPNGVLKKFSSQNVGLTFDGDTITMRGKVGEKYTKDGENYLDCVLRADKQDGTVVARGSATVTLPSRT